MKPPVKMLPFLASAIAGGLAHLRSAAAHEPVNRPLFLPPALHGRKSVPLATGAPAPSYYGRPNQRQRRKNTRRARAAGYAA